MMQKFTLNRNSLIVIILAAVFIAASILVISITSGTNSKKLIIKITPEEALPVSIITAEGNVGTYLVPEFEISYSDNMEYIDIVSKAYKSSGQLRPTFPEMEIKLEKVQEQENVYSGNPIIFGEGDTIVNYKEYGGGRWISGTINYVESSYSEKIVVEKSGTAYITIDVGSSLNINRLIGAGVPQDIATEIVRESNDL